jgi:hypothetical protein
VSDDPVLLGIVALAEALVISPGLLRLWAHQKNLTNRGYDAKGRALYDLAEGYRVQAELQQSRRAPDSDGLGPRQA